MRDLIGSQRGASSTLTASVIQNGDELKVWVEVVNRPFHGLAIVNHFAGKMWNIWILLTFPILGSFPGITASTPPTCKNNLLDGLQWSIGSPNDASYSWPQGGGTPTNIVENSLEIDASGGAFYKELSVQPGDNLVLTANGTLLDDNSQFTAELSISCAVPGAEFVSSRNRATSWLDGEMVPALLEVPVPTDSTTAAVTMKAFDVQRFQLEDACLQTMNSFDTIVASMHRYYSHFLPVYDDHGEDLTWDEITAQYRDQALAVEANPAEFANVLVDMFAILKDLHITVSDGSNVLYPYIPPSEPRNWAPGYQYVLIRLEDGATIRNSYVLGNDGDYGFFLPQSLLQQQEDEFYQVALPELKDMIDGSDSPPGLIIDLRVNSGGSEFMAREIASLFARESHVYARQKWRKNYKHDDYFETDPRVLPARADDLPAYTKPVVVIIGRTCVSSCEGMVMMLRTLPNVAVVGAATGGASGNPTAHVLGNGVTVQYSKWVSLLPNGVSIERNGISPDRLFEASATDDSDTTYDFALSALKELIDAEDPNDDAVPGKKYGFGAWLVGVPLLLKLILQ